MEAGHLGKNLTSMIISGVWQCEKRDRHILLMGKNMEEEEVFFP